MLRLKLESTEQIVICTTAVIVPMAVIGGWFGSQLLPPLAPLRRRRDNSPAWV
jgi:hypothetical protein